MDVLVNPPLTSFALSARIKFWNQWLIAWLYLERYRLTQCGYFWLSPQKGCDRKQTKQGTFLRMRPIGPCLPDIFSYISSSHLYFVLSVNPPFSTQLPLRKSFLPFLFHDLLTELYVSSFHFISIFGNSVIELPTSLAKSYRVPLINFLKFFPLSTWLKLHDLAIMLHSWLHLHTPQIT